MGLRGLIMPFIIVAPIQAGLLDVTGGLLAVRAPSASSAGALYLRLSGLYRLPVRVGPDGPRAWPRRAGAA